MMQQDLLASRRVRERERCKWPSQMAGQRGLFIETMTGQFVFVHQRQQFILLLETITSLHVTLARFRRQESNTLYHQSFIAGLMKLCCSSYITFSFCRDKTEIIIDSSSSFSIASRMHGHLSFSDPAAVQNHMPKNSHKTWEARYRNFRRALSLSFFFLQRGI